MEPESPSPYPRVPATCPYAEPTPSSPHDPLQLPEDANTHKHQSGHLVADDTSKADTSVQCHRQHGNCICTLQIPLLI
jgi:hypothetical protein